MKSKNPSDKMAEYIRYHACETGCLIDGPGHEDCSGCPAAEALTAYESSGKMWVDDVRSQEILEILAANSCPRTYDVKAWDDCPHESGGHTQTDATNVCEDCWLAYLRREEE